ncbi:MAG: redoxin domain-containing protein [Candidatus Sungbacteria bacterium]|nr:redoxin domain-containing protein [Candidatus Sungbacteria bacterium]
MGKKTIIISAAAIIIGGFLIFTAGGNRPDINLAITNDVNSKEKLVFKDAVGKKAPDFALESIDGKTVKLNDYLGKNVVLFFNEGAMCYPACWDQIAGFGNDPRFDTENVAAFSIVVDSKGQWQEIVSKSPNLAKSKILFDAARSVSRAYDVLYLNSSMHPGGFPGHTYFIIDKNGIIRFTLDDPLFGLSKR